jgi:hypothetical protein
MFLFQIFSIMFQLRLTEKHEEKENFSEFFLFFKVILIYSLEFFLGGLCDSRYIFNASLHTKNYLC